MLTLQPFLRDRLRLSRSASLATFWKIRQTIPYGAQTYRFTDWPHQLVLGENGPADGQVYSPIAGIDATARDRDAEGDNNTDIRGILSDGGLLHEDFAARRFDGAEITEYLAYVDTAWKGYITYDLYHIESTAFDGAIWRASCVGLSALIGEAAGAVWGPVCRADVFSVGPGKCNADPTPWTFTSVIGEIYTDRLHFLGNDLPAADGVLNDGKLVWTSGNNIGIYSDVRLAVEIVPAGHQEITLQTRTPLPMQIGDGFIVSAGCNKLAGIGASAGVGHCKPRYGNLANFQGEPHIPGRDSSISGSNLV